MKFAIRFTYLMCGLCLCTALAAQEGGTETSAQLMEMARNKSGAVLIAFGREARTKLQYSDAITYFQAALQTTAGRTEFQRRLLQVLDRLDLRSEAYYADFFDLVSGRLPNGKGLSRKGDGLFSLIVDSYNHDTTSGTQNLRLSMEFYGLRKSAKADGKPSQLTQKAKEDLFALLIADLVKDLSGEFPDNPIRVVKRGAYWFLEGFLSADYPKVTGNAYYELANTYRMQGDYILALRYFDELLNRPVLLPFPEAKIDVLYQKIDILQVKDQSKVPEIVKKLLADDRQYNSGNSLDSELALRNQSVQAMTTKLKKQGLDRKSSSVSGAMDLFRYTDNAYRKAHILLGVLNLQDKNNEEALPHLAYATIQALNTLVERIRYNDPMFEYPGLNTLLALVRKEPSLLEYCQSTQVYEGLYYLGVALQRDPEGKAHALSIFKTLATSPEAGMVQVLAQNRLAN